VRLRTLLRSGIRISVGCSEGCSVRAQALLPRRRARRIRPVTEALTLAGRVVAQVSASRRRVLRIKLRRGAKRRIVAARRPLMQLKVSARDAAGNARAVVRRIRVKRNR
jgi:hypothetical protein